MVQVPLDDLDSLLEQRARLDAAIAQKQASNERREARRKAISVHTSTILAGDSPSPSKREYALCGSPWSR